MNLEKVLNYQLAPVEHKISAKDCMIYGLGIGLGTDPVDPKQLQFVYEDGLKAFPSQAVVIAHPGPWVTDPELEINWLKLLHGEQTVEMHQPLKPDTTYVGEYKVRGVVDKGADKGAILYQEKVLTDKETGEKVSTVTSSYFMRGDGGCGSSGYEPPAPTVIPDRDADKSVNIATYQNSALIYRLSGDFNPIHADPAKAAKAGFDRPILHGLCTFGVAVRAAMEAYCDSDPAKFAFAGLRFSKPVMPGETIQVNFWEDGSDIKFNAFAVERNVKVLDAGSIRVK